MYSVTAKITDAVIDRHREKPVQQIADQRHPVKFRYRKDRDRGSWFVVRHAGGRSVWRKVGDYPAITPKALFKRLPDIMITMADDTNAESLGVGQLETVNDVIDWFEQRSMANRDLSKQRKAGIKCCAKRIKKLIGYCYIDDVTPPMIDDELIRPLQELKYSNAYIRQIYDILRLAFSRASSVRKVNINPMTAMKFTDFVAERIKEKPGRLYRHLLPVLFDQLKAAPAEKQALAVVMLLAGTRIGETKMMRWDHIDFREHELIIPAQNTKTGKQHIVPLTKTMIAILKRYRAAQEYDGYRGVYLFPNKQGRHINDSKASEFIRSISGKQWAAHDLRKLARSVWAHLGIDYFVGERLLNHSLSKLDQTYVHEYTEENKRAALEKYHTYLRNMGLAKILQDL